MVAHPVRLHTELKKKRNGINFVGGLWAPYRTLSGGKENRTCLRVLSDELQLHSHILYKLLATRAELCKRYGVHV